ncbi:MAG: thioredoxin [Clostridia bacterium]|nr:thioredoxin [Clostridia bacterium]MBR2957036.1 thioredoxin [Clostridia bacterium]MBR6635064.1 thioredoxin [Clostridia bacterium]
MAAIINKENFENLVLKSNKTVLLDFYADWCGPCRTLMPVIEQISDENPDITVGKINIDSEPELAQKFGVMTIPSLFVIKNGAVVSSSVGVKPKRAILEMVK